MTTLLYLTPADHGRSMTFAELERADAQEGYRYELIDGRLVVSPGANLSHELLVRWLRNRLEQYALSEDAVIEGVLGPARVFVAARETETVPEPDLAAYVALPIDEYPWRDISPLLVVEVLSTDNAAKDLERNRELYLAVPSIREYWMLDPRQGIAHLTLMVLRRRGRRWGRPITVGHGGTYTTKLLPGFTLVVDPRR